MKMKSIKQSVNKKFKHICQRKIIQDEMSKTKTRIKVLKFNSSLNRSRRFYSVV